MKRFLSEINGQEKVPYESQIALWIYDCWRNRGGIEYESSIISEELINDFNREMRDTQVRDRFVNILNKNTKLIDNKLQQFENEPWRVVKPVIWGDRNRDNYYIKNLTDSHRFEVYIEILFAQHGVDLGLYYGKDEQYNQGENELGIEIKRDKKSSEGSPNLFIEYQERLNTWTNNWVNSGILRMDNTRFYLIGDIDNFWIFNKEDLINIYNKLCEKDYYEGCKMVPVGRGTAKGYIMPKEYANKISISFKELLQKIK